MDTLSRKWDGCSVFRTNLAAFMPCNQARREKEARWVDEAQAGYYIFNPILGKSQDRLGSWHIPVREVISGTASSRFV
jgi:hypothetical protein